MTVLAPSSAEQIPGMLAEALSMTSPTPFRFPKTLPVPFDGETSVGLHARQVVRGAGSLCLLAVGKIATLAHQSLTLLGDNARRVISYDVRELPPDRSMIDIALGHDRIMTIEDGTRHGGTGSLMVSAARERAQDLNAPLPTTRILVIPRAYLEHHRPDALLEELGLDPKGLAMTIERLLSVQPEFPTVPPRALRAPYLGVGDVSNTTTSS